METENRLTKSSNKRGNFIVRLKKRNTQILHNGGAVTHNERENKVKMFSATGLISVTMAFEPEDQNLLLQDTGTVYFSGFHSLPFLGFPSYTQFFSPP